MRLFLATFCAAILIAFPAWAICPDKPSGEYAFPARLEPLYPYGVAYFAKFKSLLGKECINTHLLNFYAIYEYPSGDMFVAAVSYYDGKPATKAGFWLGYYNIYIGLPEADDRNVPAGEFRHSDYLCCPPECVDDGFVTCVATKFSKKFPFDIIGNLPSSAITCPALSIELIGESRTFDLCWIYEGMRPLKYAVAMSLLIKLFLHS
jgi:hypothetical protein